MADALSAVASASATLVLLPSLFDRFKSHGSPDGELWFTWAFHDEEAGLLAGGFHLGTVEAYVDALTTGSPDLTPMNQLREYLRRLSLTGLFGASTRLPYLQLGNEWTAGPGRAAEAAWLILTTCQLMAGADPSEDGLYAGEPACLGDVVRVFPALPSLDNRDTPGAPFDPKKYLDTLSETLDQTFFHLVRAAMMATEATGQSTRYTRVLGGAISVPFCEFRQFYSLYGFWYGLLRTLLGLVPVPGSDPVEITWPPPATPRDLNVDDRFHRVVLRAWSETTGMRCPFQAMDFHWFNSNGRREADGTYRSFLYLSAARDYVTTARDLLAAWGWSDVPLWCTETGISSHLNPCHFYLSRATEGSAACYIHLGVTTATLDELPATWADGTAVGEHCEYRVDPARIAALYGDDVWQQPRWAFTDPIEQAKQVWTRLSYLVGLGVSTVLWHTNVGEALGADASSGVQEFYSWGVTDDTVVSRWNAGECVARQIAEYNLRAKKLAFCALQRWNRYLDRSTRARVLTGLDGTGEALASFTGFYAVLFERDAATTTSPEYRYALVVWGDPQAQDRAGDAFPADALSNPADLETLVMFRTTAALEPLQVATLPSPYPGSDVPNGSPDGPVTLESACLEPGELPDPVDLETSPGDADKYHGRCVWRFDADVGVATSPLAEYRTAMLWMSTAGPRLYLLPDGELSVVGVTGYQTMKTWLAG